ncbi:hypothetical protein Bbelb_130600, partial [Branchiostoma belcheri]
MLEMWLGSLGLRCHATDWHWSKPVGRDLEPAWHVTMHLSRPWQGPCGRTAQSLPTACLSPLPPQRTFSRPPSGDIRGLSRTFLPVHLCGTFTVLRVITNIRNSGKSCAEFTDPVRNLVSPRLEIVQSQKNDEDTKKFESGPLVVCVPLSADGVVSQQLPLSGSPDSHSVLEGAWAVPSVGRLPALLAPTSLNSIQTTATVLRVKDKSTKCQQ